MEFKEILKRYKKEFYKDEKRVTRWEKVYQYLYNHNHPHLFYAFLKMTLRGENLKVYTREYSIYLSLNHISFASTTYEEKVKILKELIEDGDIKDYKIKGEEFNIVLFDDSKCKFEILSESLPGFYYNEIIQTQQRFGKCHHLALALSYQLLFNNDVVTGYINPRTSKYRCLHSWVEAKINGENFVLDPTMNIIIDKNSYYKLLHPQELTRVSKKQIKNDLPKYADNKLFNMHSRLYLLYHDDFMDYFDNLNQTSENSNQK